MAYFSTKELMTPPRERAAFSDRQAYVCAELSKLAYFKFEGGYKIDQVFEVIKDTIDIDDEKLQPLIKKIRLLLSNTPTTSVGGKKALAKILEGAGFVLIETFSRKGTQAFICKREIKLNGGKNKTTAFLVYRGTEKEYQDIKTDISAKLEKVEIGNETIEIHSGYLKAFREVKEDIIKTLKETSYDQLFITGHSLGGALAMVTTLMLASDTNGACYTFGAPPIGTVNIQNRLKTPIYEIINKIDIVPRLPNPWMITVIVWLIRFLRIAAKSVTFINKLFADGTWDDRLEAYIDSMTKYRHSGYISYLVGAGDEAHLRYNVSSFDRFRWWSEVVLKKSFRNSEKMLTDHYIDNYISKLRAHALSRQ